MQYNPKDCDQAKKLIDSLGYTGVTEILICEKTLCGMFGELHYDYYFTSEGRTISFSLAVLGNEIVTTDPVKLRGTVQAMHKIAIKDRISYHWTAYKTF